MAFEYGNGACHATTAGTAYALERGLNGFGKLRFFGFSTQPQRFAPASGAG
jgi:hypothetical protein